MVRVKHFIGALLTTLVMSVANAGDFKAGVHYKVLEQPQPVTVADDKILVEEAFWYGCPHCFDLEAVMVPWKAGKADDVVFKGVPAMFGRPWVRHAQLYYTAEVLGVLPKVHKEIFESIHLKQKRLLSKDDQRDLLMSVAGVSAADFDKAYDSFTVKTRMSQGDKRVRNFKIDGVPVLVVNGKYVVSGRMAGSHQAMIEVVNHLVDLERQASKI